MSTAQSQTTVPSSGDALATHATASAPSAAPASGPASAPLAAVNDTHDPKRRSWVESANQPGSDFPIQNLPYAVFRRAGSRETFRGGVAIGDQILDLAALHEARALTGEAADALAACAQSTLNTFMSLGPEAWSTLRKELSRLLTDGPKTTLVAQADAEYAVPARIGDYTDFYASIYHATAVGALFRPDNPLLPNYKWVPIGYHGRSSSIGVSGQQFRRPKGQIKPSGTEDPQLLPTRRLDYELEVGVFIGAANAPGTSIAIGDAERSVFGLCLLNDWSARDVQAWEYQPLGPFLAKNFATTISPWLVTLEALAPFRAPWTRAAQDPQPLPYLDSAHLRQSGAIDMQLEAYIETQAMRAAGKPPHRLSRSNFRHSYWTVSQLVAHHTVNGCNLEAGDLLGTGTQSGPTPDEAGSLLELTVGGKQPLTLDSGETRTFLADGDRVTFKGWCERSGYARIGFGEVAGTVLPAAG
jgi:fumarylacetoacetase